VSSAADVSEAWRIDLPNEAATAALAARIAEWIGPGDLLALSGDLGAAKTTFARMLIRRLTGNPDLEAPSPTFTLMQIYDGPGYPIVHADFYRIRRPEELFNLGWEEAIEGAVTLVEWPERAGDLLGGDRLDIAFHLDAQRGPDCRAPGGSRRSCSGRDGSTPIASSCRATLRSGLMSGLCRHPARPRF
jgi:N-acetylmuramate 1-kinase